MKEERTGGRKERKIEFSERVCGRGMEETRGGMMNTKRKRNQIFINKNCLLFSYKSPFIEYGDGE